MKLLEVPMILKQNNLSAELVTTSKMKRWISTTVLLQMTSTVPENMKKRKVSNGCIVLESVPLNMEAQMKKKKKEMQERYMKNDRNEKHDKRVHLGYICILEK